MSYGDWPKKFEGRVIKQIDLTANGDYIRFHFADSPIVSFHDELREALRLKVKPEDVDQDMVTFNAFGDCCSTSWVESFDGADSLIGQVLMKVEDVQIEPLPRAEDDDYDHVQDYCWRFSSPMGHADLIFRNDSNGYYGGSLEETDGNHPDANWKVVIK